MGFLCRLWSGDEGQGVAEYAMMMAVVLTLLIAIIQMIGSRASDVFSKVVSALH